MPEKKKVFPWRSEGFGTTSLESLALGLDFTSCEVLSKLLRQGSAFLAPASYLKAGHLSLGTANISGLSCVL